MSAALGQGSACGAATLADKLRTAPFLAQLPAADLKFLARHACAERYPAGAVLFHQGDAAEQFYVIAAGHVALFLGDADDLDSIVRIAGPGETIGEASICGGGAYPVTARLFGSGELIAIPGTALCDLLSTRVETILAMLSEMSMRLRRQIRQIMDIKMKTTAQRLGGYLAGLTEAQHGPAMLRLPYEKRLLASHLGMQPETLSRALMKLQAAGVAYHKDLDAFLIRDLAALRSFADEGSGEE